MSKPTESSPLQPAAGVKRTRTHLRVDDCASACEHAMRMHANLHRRYVRSVSFRLAGVALSLAHRKIPGGAAWAPVLSAGQHDQYQLLQSQKETEVLIGPASTPRFCLSHRKLIRLGLLGNVIRLVTSTLCQDMPKQGLPQEILPPCSGWIPR